MRVIILSFGFIQYTIPLANDLAKMNNCEVYLMEPSNKIEKYLSLVSRNVKVYPFKIQNKMRSIKNILDIIRLVKRIKRVKADIIHIQRGFPWFNLSLPFLNGTKIVTTIHDVYSHPGDVASKRIPTFFQDLIVRMSDKIIIHGHHMKKQMLEKYKIDKSRVAVISRGDYAYFYDYNATNTKTELKSSKIILFFGRIWRYKGLKYLIQAQPYINKKIPDAKILIAGSGENFNIYEQYIKDRDAFIINNRHIPDEEVADLFKKSDVVVLPYIEASQSGVIPLAYAYKKPVVVTNVGSLPEIVENNFTGIIVEPKNPEKLANAIVEILSDNELLKSMGEKGYIKIKNELSWSNAAKKTYQEYKKCFPHV